MVLALAACLPLLMVCIVGWWIGRFYKLKFGESSHSWILLVGGVLGSVGLFLHGLGCLDLFARKELPLVVGEVLMLVGGLLVAGGSFWLWYLLMGARRG
ncbi:MAG: hypothetical protein RL318_1427 [Fibrobacterota bacterium]|jgi:hypothetical protein